MSEKTWTILGVVSSAVFGIPTWWTLFIEHPETATVLWVIAPFITFALGVFTGFHFRRWHDESGAKYKEASDRSQADVELLELMKERDALRGKVESLEKIVEAGERAIGSAYLADMMDDYEESGIDSIGASPVDVMGGHEKNTRKRS